MYLKAQVLGFTLLAGLFTLPFEAAATTITATSYSIWDSLTYITGPSPTGEIDLTTLESGLNYTTVAGYSSGGYTVTGPDGSSYYLKNVNLNQGGHHYGLEGASDGIGIVKLNIPGSGANAFLFDAYCSNCGSSSLELTLSDGETFTVPNGQFGVSISHDVTWFELSASSGANAFLDYAYFGDSSLPQDIPASANEAATPVLVGGGLMVLLGAGRKKLLRRG